VNVALVAATRADKPVIERLLQLYEYDYSEYGGVDVDAHGVFLTNDTEGIWRPSYYVFFITVDGNLAGFAFVTHHQSYVGDGEVRLIDEFFVMRKYRRRGVGEHVARALFDRFPDRGEVSALRDNLVAQAFWRRVIGRYTGSAYREVTLDDSRWRGPVQSFDSRATPAARTGPA
jgi:predicted acetyltransferase